MRRRELGRLVIKLYIFLFLLMISVRLAVTSFDSSLTWSLKDRVIDAILAALVISILWLVWIGLATFPVWLNVNDFNSKPDSKVKRSRNK